MCVLQSQGSNESDYSLQSSEFSTDEEAEVLPRESEAARKETERQSLAQLEKSRVRKTVRCLFVSEETTSKKIQLLHFA